MAPPTRPVLPPSLATKLAAVGADLARGQSDRELNDVLAELSALPAKVVVRANREISDAARLGGWKPPVAPYLMRLRGLKTEQELMAQNPDYAWLFLFHGNGYVREAALDAIKDPPASPFFFAALTWRLNDWVWQVRQAAAECASRVLPRMDADLAANAASYLLGRRLAWRRWANAAALDLVFSRKDVIAACALRLEQQRTGPLANLLRGLLRYDDIDDHLPRLADKAVQPSVRAIACQCLLTGRAGWQVGYDQIWIDKVFGLKKFVPKLDSRQIKATEAVADRLRAAAHDRSSLVRRIAADALIADRSCSPDAAALIAQLANDRSSAVRWRADYLLRHSADAPPV